MSAHVVWQWIQVSNDDRWAVYHELVLDVPCTMLLEPFLQQCSIHPLACSLPADFYALDFASALKDLLTV
jgi:hypothetical protein